MSVFDSGDGRSPLDIVADDYLDRYRRCERPSITEFANAYPELAAEIRRVFPTLELMERLKVHDSESSPSIQPGLRGSSLIGASLNDYRVIRLIGHGGMGAVYLAERASLKSLVALKVMHAQFRQHSSYIRRFLIEARAAAQLHHTSIVSVFDYGETDGTVYYAMSYIRGHSLDQILGHIKRLKRDPSNLEGVRADECWTTEVGSSADNPRQAAGTAHGPAIGEAAASLGGPGPEHYYREVARLGAQVADALAYAHRRGILHRDIKPSNLLLDGLGNVWITDFGLAKFEDAEDVSQSRDVVGTIRYMAPERFHGVSDRRCDLYALGATLYEMLALRPVFAGDDHLRLIQRIANEPVAALRSLDRRIPRDLETIVLKSLRKEPKDRFATAEDMADELRRFGDNRPIQSRMPPYHERLRRWCQREPSLAAAVFLASALALAILVITSVSAVRLRRQRDDAIKGQIRAYGSEAEARRNMRRVGQRFEALGAISMAMKLAPSVGGLDGRQRLHLRNQSIAALTLPDLRVAREFDFTDTSVRAFSLDANFGRYAIVLSDGKVVVRRVIDDVELFSAHGVSQAQHHISLGFSPDGRYLAATGRARRVLQIWDLDARRLVFTDREIVYSNVLVWGFHPAHRRIFVARRDNSIAVVDLTTGQLVDRWSTSGIAADTIAISPDGTRLAHAGLSSTKVTIRATDSGRILAELSQPSAVFHVAWDPNNRGILGVGCEDDKVRLWNVDSQTLTLAFDANGDVGLVIGFFVGRELMASRGWNGQLRIWDTRDGEPILTRQTEWTPELLVDPDGHYIGPNQRSGKIQILEFASGEECQKLVKRPSGSRVLIDVFAIDGSGNRLATYDGRREITVWDLVRAKELSTLPIKTGDHWLAFKSDGSLMTLGPGLVRWPIRPSTDGVDVAGPPQLIQPYQRFPSISQDGRFGGMSLGGEGALVFDFEHPQSRLWLRPKDHVGTIAISPDGRIVATGSGSRTGVILWDGASGKPIENVPDEIRRLHHVVSFSRDGRWLLAQGSLANALVDMVTWRSTSFGSTNLKPAFSPDSRLIATGTNAGEVVLMDVPGCSEVARLENPDGVAERRIAFTPDGNRLVSNMSGQPMLRIWNLELIRKQLRELGLDWEPTTTSAGAAAQSSPGAGAQAPRQIRADLGPPGLLQNLARGAPKGLLADYDAQLVRDPGSIEIRHQRAHILVLIDRYRDAIAEFSRCLELGGDDAHLFTARASTHLLLGKQAEAEADFRSAIRVQPDDPDPKVRVAGEFNDQAWGIVKNPGDARLHNRAVAMARAAVALRPDKVVYQNTLGAALYRAGEWAAAIDALENSRNSGQSVSEGYDLLFMAMAYYRLRQVEVGKRCFDRALEWRRAHLSINPDWIIELDAFEREARRVLAESLPELPADVLAPGG